MKIEHREVIVETKMVQVTTTDERWYTKDWKTFYPSASWISSYCPKGVGFMKWLAEKGWDEAEALKEAGGVRGSKVDAAFKDLMAGKEVKMDAKYLNPKNGQQEDLTVEEWEGLLSFFKWHQDLVEEGHTVKFLAWDVSVWDETLGYAGTIDIVLSIDDVIYIVDVKTSQAVYNSHRVQVILYKHGYPQPVQKLAILQLGYRKNKDGYKWTEVEDDWDLAKAAYTFWKDENNDAKPKQKDYPQTLQIIPEKKESISVPGDNKDPELPLAPETKTKTKALK